MLNESAMGDMSTEQCLSKKRLRRREYKMNEKRMLAINDRRTYMIEMRMPAMAILDSRTYKIEMRMLANLGRRRKNPPSPWLLGCVEMTKKLILAISGRRMYMSPGTKSNTRCLSRFRSCILCYAMMLCYDMLCYVMLCCAVLCCAIPCYAMPCHAMLC